MVLVRVEEEKIEYIRKTVIKNCDICGEDATDVTKCGGCGGDFCKKHLYISELRRADFGNEERYSSEINNIWFCSKCLIERIKKMVEEE